MPARRALPGLRYLGRFPFTPMKVKDVLEVLERWAPPVLQEDYDNCGLQVGDPTATVKCALITLDCTPAVVREAARNGCNLIITHHPPIFKGLKSITGRNEVERTVLEAVRADVAIYAIHTNLDNVLGGVNGEIAARLGLQSVRVLDSKPALLFKLAVFVPMAHADAVRNAMFGAGAGVIGAYDLCSFNVQGTGTFRAGEGTDPFVGERGTLHQEQEMRIEVACTAPVVQAVVASMAASPAAPMIRYEILIFLFPCL